MTTTYNNGDGRERTSSVDELHEVLTYLSDVEPDAIKGRLNVGDRLCKIECLGTSFDFFL